MSGHQKHYDAILAAAALIHFADLSALFHAAALSLRDRGLFVFTLFAQEADAETDYAVVATTRLAQSGCFRRSIAYVKRLASETGFAVLELEKVIHEHDQNDKPVGGLLAVLRQNRD